jgi:hypothetical protein
MPVESISLTPDRDYLDIQFEGGGNFHMYIKNSSFDMNRSGDLLIYAFTNPDFIIGIMTTANTLNISVGHDVPDIMYQDYINYDLIDKIKDIMNKLIYKNLEISKAPHIGVLKEGTDIVINDKNSISLDYFEDGEVCVLIKHPNGKFTASGERCFVYHIDSLQGWFDAGNNSEPLTRVTINQDMLQRFKYSKPSGVSSSRKSSRKTRKRKARK